MRFIRPTNDRLNNSHIKLLLRGDSLTDASPNALALTNSGVTVAAAPGGHPYAKVAGYFDGVAGSPLLIPDSDDFYMPGDYTHEFWIYRLRTGTEEHLYSQDSGSGNGNPRINLFIENDNICFYDYTYSYSAYLLRTSMTLLANTWYFVQFIRSGTTASIRINGVQAASATYATPTNSSYPFKIGAGQSSTGNSAPFKGYMVDWRSSKGVVRDSSIPATPLIPDTYTKLHLPMMEYTGQPIVKDTIASKIPTIGSTLTLVRHMPANGGPALDRVVSIDGSATGFATLPYSTGLDFDTEAFTIEGWKYNDALVGSEGLCHAWSTTGWSLNADNSGNLRFYASGGFCALASSTKMPVGDW